jgi:predicted amidophosphoribosyltransferase
LVVDDVRTTGATLASVCDVLAKRGAEPIFTLALAGALEDDDAA